MSKNQSNPLTRDLIFNKHNGHCAYCGCKIKRNSFCIDHIIPLKRKSKNRTYGLNVIENYNPSCSTCNTSKNSHSIDEWREKLQSGLGNLNSVAKYVLLKRFGIIRETNRPVIFYFENHKANG